MRVVHPTTRISPDAIQSLVRTGHAVEFVDVSGSDRAYFDLLAQLWAAGETFAIIEHDIVVTPSTLNELDACPHDWCAFPFRYLGRLQYGLGCVKFSAALMARIPDAIIRIGVMSDARHDRRHWCRLDAWLTTVLESVGEVRHEHLPEVWHLDDGCSHGCTSLA